ncbi:MAG: taurine dioxygenase [Actinomycetia bacterium]|nr:taurine dioxygenase [Actinomycetes bacterium]
MTFSTQPVSPALGIEVDLDPARDLDAEEQAELRALFLEHHLILIRGHQMSVDDTVRVCGYITDVLHKEGVPPEAYVSTPKGDAVLPDLEVPWHGDMNFNVTPHLGAALYAEEIDEVSCPTWYANAARAAEKLPPELRAEIQDLEVAHDWPGTPWDPTFNPVEATRHPLLWSHPLSQKPFVYIAERQLRQPHLIDGVDPAEEKRLIDELFAILYAPDNIYEHRWQTNDLVIWDNLMLQHRRGNVTGRRTLRRLALVNGPDAAEGDEYFDIQGTMRARRLGHVATA